MRTFTAFVLFCFSACLASADNSEAAAYYVGADVVFTGFILDLQPSPEGFTAKFLISQPIKGAFKQNEKVAVGFPGKSPCDSFEDSHSYLVYAHRIGNAIWADPCEGSKLISKAEADLRYLHTVNAEVSEKCNRKHIAKLATDSPIVATAEVINTEDALAAEDYDLTTMTLFRPWCGFVMSTEDAYYRVQEVLKGQIADSLISVEHVICSDTLTIDDYSPTLSPRLFKPGNVLLLFLKTGSNIPDKKGRPPFDSVYRDQDENCGAILADDESARYELEFLHSKSDANKQVVVRTPKQ